ncbi:MAG: ATP-binding cassette domain-containing protein [Myxococcota bacterium]|nr:ATP-binding cassette domain-containing protein [Myxococcota bacterium]MDW8362931.1 ATP-binding cassette domain-containing protein [Myxococcales bacterium]
MTLRYVGVCKSFGARHVLRDVSLEVRAGECFFVIGASGVGKSVLARMAVGFVRPDAGQVWVDGDEVTAMDERALRRVRRRCAMVFQASTLFDSMSCLDNVALPLRIHGRLSLREARARARDVLASIGIEELADAWPAEIGDGSRKRVAIARALTLEPTHLLLDEPTTSLDPISARRLDRFVRALCDERRLTVLVVSHDRTSVATVADRVAMLYRGRVHALGTPAELFASSDGIVRQFLEGRAEGPMELDT